jgi:hypothetical protein
VIYLSAAVLFGAVLELAARPSYHGNNLDDLACLVMPMIVLGVVFLIAMRKGEQDAGEHDAEEILEADAGETREPERSAEGTTRKKESP